MGDLSAEALCKEYDLNVERLFRIRGGEEYEFDDVKIEVISARHTESKGGNYWDRGYCIQKDGSRRETMWYGSLKCTTSALPMLMDTEPLSGVE